MVHYFLPDQNRQPYLTWLLMAANFLVWIALEVSGRSSGLGGSENPQTLLDFGAMFGPLIANGEYWRLFTSMFLHVGMMHLLFNSIGLLIFGRIVEGTYGRLRFALIYVLAGLAGSVASYIINSAAIGAGASGAIFGVLGALVAFLVANREMLGEVGRQTLVAIAVLAAINIFFGFADSGVDNWAHLGGLAGGFALGMALTPRYKLAVGPFGMERQLVHSGAQTGWAVPLMMGTVLIAGAWLGTRHRAGQRLHPHLQGGASAAPAELCGGLTGDRPLHPARSVHRPGPLCSREGAAGKRRRAERQGRAGPCHQTGPGHRRQEGGRSAPPLHRSRQVEPPTRALAAVPGSAWAVGGSRPYLSSRPGSKGPIGRAVSPFRTRSATARPVAGLKRIPFLPAPVVM